MTMFSLTEDAKGKSLAIFYADGESDSIPETHISFKAIVEKLVSGTATDEGIRELANVLETVARKMQSLSERVSVDGKNVYFDGDPLHEEIGTLIKKMVEEGRSLDFKPLVNFLEKAKTNPSLKSIDDLYRWIKNGDLVIDPEGDIIAYKGVRVNDQGLSESIHAGTAFVNGEEFTGYIPNVPGTVISMPRSNVNDNEYVACSTGLHAGTYSYASDFASYQYKSRLILVKINPRDVVSVPADSSDQKLRVSRYTVLTQIEERLNEAVYQPELPEPDEIDEDYFEDDDYDENEDFLGEDFFDEDEDEEEDVAPIPEQSETAKFFTGVFQRIADNAANIDDKRDALGRFTKDFAASAKRDTNGRFISGK